MLDDMLATYLARDFSGGFWLTCDAGGPVGIAHAGPERLAEGTWYLHLIAVHPDHQRQGRGTLLLREVEQALRARGERILLVEVSGAPEFAAAHAFYRTAGFADEARIRDFYQEGEDKIVFRKALAAGPS
jgi:ribosomal protein S18 acetylase RimI-like enzyme